VGPSADAVLVVAVSVTVLQSHVERTAWVTARRWEVLEVFPVELCLHTAKADGRDGEDGLKAHICRIDAVIVSMTSKRLQARVAVLLTGLRVADVAEWEGRKSSRRKQRESSELVSNALEASGNLGDTRR
jgi:hypothetical protein